ncbi:MAG: HAD hydrolase-like protein, partial [Clostridia bacterium]|nr:HAD hydrolase-like protein [Clostridia bacterium]
IDKDKIIYIGDSEVDFEFASNCDMEFIGVSWGFRKRDQLLDCGAQTIADSVAELKSYLDLSLAKQ